ncbi:hypothetical protein K6V06_13680 [Cupriavidus sp. AU9028]|nr:hypothetical protein [Cupriavidus sp. AU9028]
MWTGWIAPAPVSAQPAAVSPAASSPPALPDAAVSPAAAGPVIRTVGAISYACGGIGADEQQALAKRKTPFNLGLLFTEGARGEYLSDVDVRLMRDDHEVARFRADGPRCLIKAPPGRYNVHATFNGQSRSMTVQTGSWDNQLRW